jgi:hypothetical protein
MLTQRYTDIIAKIMRELNMSYSEALTFIERVVNNELSWMRQHPESEDSHGQGS